MKFASRLMITLLLIFSSYSNSEVNDGKSVEDDQLAIVEDRVISTIDNATEVIVATIAKSLLTKKSFEKTMSKIPCITQDQLGEIINSRSHDINFNRILDKIEESKDTAISLLHSLREFAAASLEQNEDTYINLKDQVVNSIENNLNVVKSDLARDNTRTEERIIAELQDNADSILQDVRRIESKIEKMLMEMKLEFVDTLQQTKYTLIESQEKLIDKYTGRIVAQVIFILGFAVGLITEYDYYKEKINWILGLIFKKASTKKRFFLF